MADTRFSSRTLWIALSLVLLAIVAYLPFLDLFMILDDLPTIERYSVERERSWTAALELYSNGSWRPAANLTFVAINRIFGLNPLAFHMTSVLLHAVVTVVLYLVSIGMLGNTRALLAAVYLAISPAAFFAVSQIANIADQFLAISLLLGWFLYGKALDSSSHGGRVLVIAVAVLCLLIKESGVVIAAILIVEALYRRRLDTRACWVLVPVVLAALVRAAIAAWFQARSDASYYSEGRIVLSLQSLVRQIADYSLSTILPQIHLTGVPFVSINPGHGLLWAVRIALMVAVAAMTIRLIIGRCSRAESMFLIVVALYLPVVPMGGPPEGRFLYPALPFLFLGISSVRFRNRLPRAWIAAVAGVYTSFSLCTLWLSPCSVAWRKTCNEVEAFVVDSRRASKHWQSGDRILILDHPHPGRGVQRWAYCQLLFRIFVDDSVTVVLNGEEESDRAYRFSGLKLDEVQLPRFAAATH